MARLSLHPICNVHIKLGETACKLLYMDISPLTNTLIKISEISEAFVHGSLQDPPQSEKPLLYETSQVILQCSNSKGPASLELSKTRSDHRLKCRNRSLFYKPDLFFKFEIKKKIF